MSRGNDVASRLSNAVRTLRLLLFVATVSVSQTADANEVLTTAKGSIRFSLGSDWKRGQIQRQPSQTTVQYTKQNPASTASDFATTITISTFQTQWPDVSAKYTRFVNSVGGVKSVSGPWTVRRSGLRYLDRNHNMLVAYRDIADVHLLVNLAWFHLPNNDSGYDGQIEKAFHSLLASISGGIGPPR
jgi:hypothetical protein